MAIKTYDYLVTDTANDKVDSDALKSQIANDANVTIQINSVDYDDTDITIEFADDLPGTQKADHLDGIVSAHDGEPLTRGPELIDFDSDNKTTEQGILKVAHYKGEGSDFSRASHDWTDKTTWYYKSTRVTGETPTLDTGLVYDLANSNIIDLTHGKVSDEDAFSSAYDVVVYDGGTPISGVTVDYVNGKVTLPSAPSGALTADYSYENGSEYCLKPDAGKVLYLEHAEVQFSSDIAMKHIEFQIWAYNPLDLPNKVMVKNKVYKNEKDILNSANLGQGKIQAFGDLTKDILVFPFNYVMLQPMKSSQGTELRIVTKDDEAFSGEFATVTFYCFSENE